MAGLNFTISRKRACEVDLVGVELGNGDCKSPILS